MMQHLFLGVFRIIAPFRRKWKEWVLGRLNWKKETPILPNSSIWFHLASLGEYEQALPVINRMRDRYPEHPVVLTFFSPSGYNLVQPSSTDIVLYLPLDTRKTMSEFISRINPAILLLTKYDFWYQTLRTCEEKKVPVVLISGVFHQGHYYFKPWGKWMLKRLKKLSHAFVQSPNDLTMALEHQISATLAGDSRIERSRKLPTEEYTSAVIESFKGDSNMLILASTHLEDERKIIPPLLKQIPQGWKILIAPHELDRQTIDRLVQSLDQCGLYTEANETSILNWEILILNTIGELKYVYRYADAAYIGGGYGSGIHNILEPLSYGLDVAIGPNHMSFHEARILKQKQALVVFSDPVESEEIDSFFNVDQRKFRIQNQKAFWDQSMDTSGLVVDWIAHNLDL